MPYIGMITTEEDLTPVKVPADAERYRKDIEHRLSATLLDVVPSVQPFRYCLLTDDESQAKRKPYNRIATYLYAKNNQHDLYGDVAVVRVDPILHDWEPFPTMEECSAALLELMQFILS